MVQCLRPMAAWKSSAKVCRGTLKWGLALLIDTHAMHFTRKFMPHCTDEYMQKYHAAP